MGAESGGISGAHRSVAFIGAVVHLGVAFLVAASSLVAPPWAVVVLWVAWIAAAAWAIRTWRRHAFVPLLAAGLTVVFWVGFITFGDLVLGWTA